jgi:hypothetical protein
MTAHRKTYWPRKRARMKYVKRPIPIEAVQWQGKFGDPPQVKAPGPEHEHLVRPKEPDAGVITTDHGDMAIRKGDWVLGPGAAGEYWPVANEVFAQTYVPAEEAAEEDK